ncbi:ATP-binding protein [Tritonibacter mobilis]|uniref:ATP-binding protein n=1 Tax=Tritonibacter mobilis TaxID=379347 RepID=UPI001C09FC35|nr:ATP-binding protein [Tritonibacter mobilis]MBU3035472.1 ATP-binding protein [Tritonibacter mobilis]WHQ83932.1 ATP-binding protein [Tritonibacter mobilis]
MARINLRKFIAEHYKGGVTARDVIREAITNSIHAKATDIKVNLRFSERQGEIFNHVSERVVLEGISIEDDGEGFTRDNVNYFDEICTSHKDRIGGKGVGRLSYLKYANKVHVKSQLEDELVEFPYTPDFNVSDVKRCAQSGPRLTVITLTDLKEQINTHVRNLVASLCDDLRLLVFLKYQAGQSITITFHHNSGQPFDETHQLVGRDIKTERTRTFEVNSEIFDCYMFKDLPPSKGIVAMLCADELCIEEYTISKRFDICRYQISITSPYFNMRSNIERKRLEIPKDADLVSPISRDELMRRIHHECMEMINEADEGEIEKFKSGNVERLKKFYPFIDVSSLGGNAALLDADEIVRSYRVQQSRREDQLVDAIQQGIQPSWDDVSHLASDDLARFIVHRALVIDSLSKMPNDAAEEVIHRSILPKRSDGSDIRENNIWLIDDKFLSYSSIFSDEALSKILLEVNQKVERDQKRKPDVAAFFSKDDMDSPNKLVIVEFKKPGADLFDNNKSLVQCRLYASELADRIETIREVFAFSIVDIDSQFYRDMKQQGFKDVFSLSDRVVYNDFEVGGETNIPLHMYVLPASALIKDAQARNKVFEDVLRLNLEDSLRNSAGA